MKETADYAALRGDDQNTRYTLRVILQRSGSDRCGAVRRVLFVGARSRRGDVRRTEERGKAEARGHQVRAGYCEAKNVQ